MPRFGSFPHVTEIIVGPGFNQDAVFNGIAYYLSKGKVIVPFVPVKEMNMRIQGYIQDTKKENINSGSVNRWIKKWNDRYAVIETDFSTDMDSKEAVSRLYQEFKIF